jgi:DNA polymerase delta subunit 1
MGIPPELAARSKQISTRNNNLDDIAFQVISWYATDANLDGDSGDTAEDMPISASTPSNKSYVIKMFGVTDEGATISVSVTNFCPFFWIKLTPSANPQRIDNDIRYQLERKGFRDHYAGYKLLQRKDIWGFTNFKESTFMKLFFKSRGAARAAQYHLGRSFKLYESNIEPFLRFIHVKDIQPCGWVTLPGGKYRDTFVLPTNCQYDVEIQANSIGIFEEDISAKFLIASFDIECMSDTGDFPVAKKTYKRVAADLYDLYQEHKNKPPADVHNILFTSLDEKLSQKPTPSPFNTLADIEFKDPNPSIPSQAFLAGGMDDILVVLNNVSLKREDAISKLDDILSRSIRLPPLAGDKVIQIGTTFHYYGDRNLMYRHIITLGTCDPIDSPDVPTTVEPCETEAELLVAWQRLISTTNPDILTGYNIFGFDMQYLYQRAQDLRIERNFMMLSRFTGFPSKFETTRLSSSALGDNFLNYIDMYGRVSIDMMKVIQRDHKLDSFKLDNVAYHFLKQNKNDVSPHDIFRLQRQGAAERKTVAEYCLQDCALCNHLMIKLEIIANNMGMSNVCLVPLTYIFMRGQGIKIFSLVLKQCADDGFVMPVIKMQQSEVAAEDDEGYEGAIVLEPDTGIYLDTPISVLDYASLYPSSMISENISHDCYVMDERYANLPGVNYLDITFDLADGKKQVCRFAQNRQGLIPRILQKLLKARKTTRLKMEWEEVNDGTTDKTYTGMVATTPDAITITALDGTKTTLPLSPTITRTPLFNSFQKAVLDGLQLAYKITANSLYGQIGARTSPIYLKELAACTTAVGRSMIMKAKAFIETNYPDARIIYGDTDSVFVKFSTIDPITGEQLKGLAARERAWELAEEASTRFKKSIKPPHNLEVDKVFHPFILLSKKRYVGNKYEGDMNKFKQTSMGIVLKRRDNANIVKKIYGGVIDIILNKQDIRGSIDFLKQQLDDLIAGKTMLDELVITKSLRADYKDPTRIAHKVLSERIGERDPGNKPQVNDRIPYVYIQEPEPTTNPETGKVRKVLQGERIETPSYITANNLKPDYGFYITNQIMKPVLQLYAIIADKIGLRSAIQYQQAYQEFLDGGIAVEKAADKLMALKEKDVKQLLFDPFLNVINPPKPKKTKATAVPKLSTTGIPTTIIDGIEVSELPKRRTRQRKTTTDNPTTPPITKSRVRVVKSDRARIEIPL